MTPKQEMQLSPQGRNALEFEGLARAPGRERDQCGKKPTWARRNLDKAAASWLAVSLELGQTIAAPTRPFEYNGRIALRIPRSLHGDVVELAQLQGCSVNQLLTVAVSEYVGKLGLPQVGAHLASK